MSFISPKKFSRLGKVYDFAGKNYCVREKSEPPPLLKQISAEDVEKELKKVQKEIDLLEKTGKAHSRHSSCFLSPSREKLEKINKPSNLESPPSTKYNPRINFLLPRVPEVSILRSVSGLSRNQKIYIPTCVDTEDLTCHYPVKRKNTLNSEISYIDFNALRKKIKQRTTEENTLDSSWSSRASLSFDKQLPRKYTSSSQIEARFETVNFPKLFSKYKSSPSVDFGKISPRKEPQKSFTPSPYIFSDKIIKRKANIGAYDMSKAVGVRFSPEKYKVDTINQDKVAKAYNIILPKTHISTPNFEKITARAHKHISKEEDKKYIYEIL
ncbi:unnamed protein product [Blepharisma stoltei]|uniref:Uncharacterized protein n=1 Tax=Blepharisma stoltei TaxID=1481888 RepID=A0AAU9JQN4_9CILI|nr:unnamed protein product [Blepharisma stoltei]